MTWDAAGIYCSLQTLKTVQSQGHKLTLEARMQSAALFSVSSHCYGSAIVNPPPPTYSQVFARCERPFMWSVVNGMNPLAALAGFCFFGYRFRQNLWVLIPGPDPPAQAAEFLFAIPPTTPDPAAYSCICQLLLLYRMPQNITESNSTAANNGSEFAWFMSREKTCVSKRELDAK